MSSIMGTQESRGITRRAVLAGGTTAAGIITLSLTSCGGSNGEDANGNEGSGDSAPDPDRPKEAPMLSELVEAGDLPPLEERLPVESDRLILDVPEYGVYGGNYRGAVLGQGDDAWITRMVAFEPMLPQP